MGDEDILYELLLNDIDVETLMDEDNFEIDMRSRDRLQGVEQEDLRKIEGICIWTIMQ